jgi:catechol 2,3-dioxygenase-like lactoylglutathione lyase family enzyme
MAVTLDHTIVAVRNKAASAVFLADILGLDAPKPVGPFMCVETANGVGLAYDDRSGSVPGHYAFLVTEDEFDAIFARIRQRELRFWADPQHTRESTINDNGRGLYFEDADGNNLEVLTRSHGA